MTPRAGRVVALGLVLLSCSGADDAATTPDASAPDLTAVGSAAEILERVLDDSHGKLRGTLDRVVLQVRAEKEAPPDTVTLLVPDRVRWSTPGGRQRLLNGDEGWSRVGTERPERLPSTEREELARLATLLGAVLLAPLVDAKDAAVVAPARVAFTAAGSACRWELDLAVRRDGRLAPKKLASSLGTVTFEDLYDSGETLVPERVLISDLGRRWVRILANDVEFGPRTFSFAVEANTPQLQLGDAPRPRTPEFQQLAGCRWLMLPDPATWPERIDAISEAASRLAAAGQVNGGDPFLLTEGERAWVVVRFEGGDAASKYEPTGDEVVRDVAAHIAAVVHPEANAYPTRVAEGTAALEQFAERHRAAAGGGVRQVLNVYFEPPTTAAARRELDLRLELPIRR